MKNNNEVPKLGNKRRVAGLVLSFVAMITLVGVFTFSRYQGSTTDEYAQNEIVDNGELSEASQEDSATEETNADQIANDVTDVNEEEVNEASEETSGSNIVNEEVSASATTNASIEEQISFTEDQSLLWPVNGGVIMHYSMDEMVYFATLDQYKLNSAMIVDGEVGTEVLAAEMGIVVSITEEVETGTTLTIDMGNGYTAVYGQLTDVRVSEGSVVERGQILGVLADPTIYYSEEGCNLYFQLLIDGEPVNPFMYME